MKYHHWFGTNLSRARRIIGFEGEKHKVWKGKTNYNYPNQGLERSIWDNQGIVEQTQPHSTC
jgi:hypothetical protein